MVRLESLTYARASQQYGVCAARRNRMADPVKIAERLTEAGALQNLSPPVQTALFLGAMALIPAALVCLTSFTRIVIVQSFVRRAVTSQEIPPNCAAGPARLPA
jgi:flagellar biosynthesis protein FliP